MQTRSWPSKREKERERERKGEEFVCKGTEEEDEYMLKALIS